MENGNLQADPETKNHSPRLDESWIQGYGVLNFILSCLLNLRMNIWNNLTFKIFSIQQVPYWHHFFIVYIYFNSNVVWLMLNSSTMNIFRFIEEETSETASINVNNIKLCQYGIRRSIRWKTIEYFERNVLNACCRHIQMMLTWFPRVSNINF